MPVSLSPAVAALPGLTTEISDKYKGDWLIRCGAEDEPAALLRPQTVEEVSAILRACSDSGTHVVPQGGLTGLTGASTPTRGAVLVCMERMNRILEVDPVSLTITVEAGVTMQAIQEAADAAGLMFPLDIGSRGTCQIGGNISTNAGGNRVLRYGMTRDLVLGLEAVLADGTIISSMNRMLKNNSAYDLKQLFIGSEGTLGIITKAVLKLFPKPRSVALSVAALADYPAVERFLALARARLAGELTAYEAMWPSFFAYGVARSGRPAPLQTEGGMYVLLELSASDESADAKMAALLEEALEAGVVLDATLAQSVRQAREIWAIRDASGELAQAFHPIANMDVSVPTSVMGPFAQDCAARLKARWPAMELHFFGHVADGNLHIMAGHFGEATAEPVENAVYECVRDFEGSISAEHGIGLQKRAKLHYSRNAPEIALMRALKAALDPKGILNPGKVFDPTG